MEVNCEGCAGCCLDWRPLAPETADLDHERRGAYRPLDDTYNLAPLTRDGVRAFVDAGEADALAVRLFRAADGPTVTVGGIDLAAVAGRPAFLVGLRKVPKPVAPFGAERTWLPTCAYLDPETLQCRIHGADRYPETCADYPGANLDVGAETECERVERAHGGTRLVDDDPPADATPHFGPGAVGSTVFVHPGPDRIAGAVERIAAGETTRDDRAEFVAVAAASSPGAAAVSDPVYEDILDRAREADSWVGRAIDEWTERAGTSGERVDSDEAAVPDRDIAVEFGGPNTPGWE